MGENKVNYVKEAVDFSTVLRTAGLTVDIIASAIILKMVTLFRAKTTELSIKEITNAVESVLEAPEFMEIRNTQMQSQQGHSPEETSAMKLVK